MTKDERTEIIGAMKSAAGIMEEVSNQIDLLRIDEPEDVELIKLGRLAWVVFSALDLAIDDKDWNAK